MTFHIRPEQLVYLSIAGLGGYGSLHYGLKGITHLSLTFFGTKPFNDRVDQFFDDFLKNGTGLTEIIFGNYSFKERFKHLRNGLDNTLCAIMCAAAPYFSFSAFNAPAPERNNNSNGSTSGFFCTAFPNAATITREVGPFLPLPYYLAALSTSYVLKSAENYFCFDQCKKSGDCAWVNQALYNIFPLTKNEAYFEFSKISLSFIQRACETQLKEFFGVHFKAVYHAIELTLGGLEHYYRAADNENCCGTKKIPAPTNPFTNQNVPVSPPPIPIPPNTPKENTAQEASANSNTPLILKDKNKASTHLPPPTPNPRIEISGKGTTPLQLEGSKKPEIK